MLKTNVEQNEGNKRSYFLFISLWGRSSKKFPRRFLCVHQVKKLFENFLIESQL